MDFSRNFGHFLAHFVPGAIFLAGLLLVVDSFYNVRLLTLVLDWTGSSIGSFLVISTVSLLAGIVIDNLRHYFAAFGMQRKWAEMANINPEKIKHRAHYVAIIGKDAYQVLSEDLYDFYEFDLNMAGALIPLLIGLANFLIRPGYYEMAFKLPYASGVAFTAIIVLIFLQFLHSGIAAYRIFMDALIATIEYSDKSGKIIKELRQK